MRTIFAREASRAVLLLVLALITFPACDHETALDLGKPEAVAEGVQLYRVSDPRALDPIGPVAIQILRLDPSKVDLRCALAQERPMSLETVADISARHKALAAINAGFFIVKNGDPVGVLEIDKELVSDTTLTRGAVGIVRARGQAVHLLFDRVGATVRLRYGTGRDQASVAIDGVDTTRVRGKLMLYTPRFGPDSDTAGNGVEWQLAGTPLRVGDRRENAGKTLIPRDGAVLSFGGTTLPAALDRLGRGDTVRLDAAFQTRLGSNPADWAAADDIVGGAGLLVHKGKVLRDWTDEQFRLGFDTERHPRTMVGTNRRGIIWLVTVDGRNPVLSLGMTFAELQRLAVGLQLDYALNLDGGGSTTMVVGGTIVNHPSDQAGPRKVSDALIVVPRKR
jgi:hypothetical protein